MDKPETVREILEEIADEAILATNPDCIAQALSDIYSLLSEGVEDKIIEEHYAGIGGGFLNEENTINIGFNQANAEWRKHLQERLK